MESIFVSPVTCVGNVTVDDFQACLEETDALLWTATRLRFS